MALSLEAALEAGFGLPCLNHACDSNVEVMSDLFGTDNRNGCDVVIANLYKQA